MPIILLTNDAGNRAAAAAMGLTALSLQQYVRSRTDAPELQDLVARQVGDVAGAADDIFADSSGLAAYRLQRRDCGCAVKARADVGRDCVVLCLQEFMDEDEAALAAEGITPAAAAGSRGGTAGPSPGSSRVAAAAAAGGSGQRSSKRKRVYEQHRPMSDINAGEFVKPASRAACAAKLYEPSGTCH
jgi:hypothetical protein